MKLFDFYIKKKIKAALRSNNRVHTFRNMESMQTIFILCNYNQISEIEPILADLKQKGKTVILWTVQPTKELPLFSKEQSPSLRIITAKEQLFLNIVSAPVLAQFKSLTYDTLLDLTTHSNRALLYLLVNNSAEFAIGIRDLEMDVFDFILRKDTNESLVETYTQLKKYLGNIQ